MAVVHSQAVAHTQRRLAFTEKSPVYRPKTALYEGSKEPCNRLKRALSSLLTYLHADSRGDGSGTSAKKPYIHSKELYIHGQKSYILSKEPYIHIQKSPTFAVKSLALLLSLPAHWQLRTWQWQRQKSPVYVLKRALHSLKRALWTYWLEPWSHSQEPCIPSYGVALVSRIDKIIGIFCKRAL